MAPVELRLSFPNLASLERELASNLKHGRAFLGEVADAEVLSDCMLLLVHPEHGTELRLPAQIVMVSREGAMRGTGIELRPFGSQVLVQIEEFIRAQPQDADSPAALPPAAPQALALPDDLECATEASEHEVATEAPAETEAETSEDDAADEDDESEPMRGGDLQHESKQDKLRHLTAAEQLKIARKGELSDRVAVERLYGKQVWEALLHNPRLTIPEVARIARKGTVPKPLLDLIIENPSWVKAPPVRRALLGNPKIGSDSVGKLLRGTPKHELKLIEKGTAYSMPVRDAARKLLKD